MKNIYFAGAFIFIFFTGCSSTYTVTDFGTKEKFYEEFNNNFKDREAKVTLVDDSSFIAQNGVEINHDTLLSFKKLEEKIHRRFALSDVTDIYFPGSTTTSASVALKNGNKLTGDEVKVTKDSISFVESKSIVVIKTLVPTDIIKTISYNDRWRRMPLGVLTGAPLGFLSGIALVNVFRIKDYHGGLDYPGVSFQMTVLGVLTGCITSYLIGFDYIYQFNP
ncbi:MAG: hypothetical protein GW805_04640 [Ignavibacteria bacterium]|nr:hypothetical protein [Ignavibacteria bacterium]NCS90080.1 hypothetical protein [Ignavibacteria bacterium]OIO15612.1 MAG: hypothetical protein AUJ54_12570 [Ignavibacteria bacterium CG1_02_37_35]